MASARSHERLAMEKHLGILGPWATTVPSSVCSGTVLGIIKAFADLSHNQAGRGRGGDGRDRRGAGGHRIGLMVAIPAVVAYNIFQGRVRRTLGRVDAMAHLILARSHEENKAEAAGSSSKGA